MLQRGRFSGRRKNKQKKINSMASVGCIDCFKQQHSVVCKTVPEEWKRVDSLTDGNGERNSYSKLSRVANRGTFIMLMRMGRHQARH